ncbi:hypothetical protein ALC53_12328 [Atta colombica]|uniref:Uncharacterized protein n=1 Tax=Atta colombica TaxID=520822 RepID=A0A195AZ82_9HYME|nr:hypothetical protein ALC53_12328 [Atta colombica]
MTPRDSRVRSREALTIKWKPPLFRAPTIFHIPHSDCSIGESTIDTTREHVHTHTSGISHFQKATNSKCPSKHSRGRGGRKIVQLAIIKSGIGGSSSTNSRQKGECGKLTVDGV